MISLKIKLLGGIGLIFFSGLACLAYGLLGSRQISKSVSIVRSDSFPALNRANELTEMVRITNNAILLSLDGDDQFEQEVLDAQDRFSQIINQITQNRDAPDLQLIHDNFNHYVKEGIEFGKKSLAGEDNISLDNMNRLSGIKKEVTMAIEGYQDKKRSLFQDALDLILLEGSSFNRIFSLVSFIQLFMVIILIKVLLKVSRDTSNMNSAATQIASGDLKASIAITRKDEMGSLQKAIEHMRISLKDHIDNLDSKVKARTAELALAQKEITDILNSIEQGIFTFNLDLSINQEHSLRAKELLQRDDVPTANLMDILHLDKKKGKHFTQWVEVIQKPRFLSNWKKYSKLCPADHIVRKLDDQNQFIKVDFQPIIEKDALNKVMVLLTDITAEKEAEKKLETHRQNQIDHMDRVTAITKFEHTDLANFLTSLRDTISQCKTTLTVADLNLSVTQLFRELHTIKGNSGTFGFHNLENIIHSAETSLSQFIESNDDDTLSQWHDIMKRADEELQKISSLENLLFKNYQQKIIINADRFKLLLNKIKTGTFSDTQTIYKEILSLHSQTLGYYCKKYKNQIEQVLKSQDKEIQVIIENEDQLIPRDLMSKLDHAIVHIINNCVAHGIETSEERIDLQKGIGTITISCHHNDDWFLLKISDDGKGLNPEIIFNKAASKGLIKSENIEKLSVEDKLNLIFSPGFSTRDEVSKLSGRGIGLDAVKNCVEELGGKVTVASELSKGSSFTLEVPVDLSENMDFMDQA
ncbi:MAG: Hpt domain-containing protein [Planctomycetes bacterium]|nr:Hpt domain-containing protein [Planctomycetota bacterium]